MIIGEATMFPSIIIGHQTTGEAKHFTYWGSIVDNNDKVKADVTVGSGKHNQHSKHYTQSGQCQKIVSGPRSICTAPSSHKLPLIPAKHGK